jgi:hypothetical protein
VYSCKLVYQAGQLQFSPLNSRFIRLISNVIAPILAALFRTRTDLVL